MAFEQILSHPDPVRAPADRDGRARMMRRPPHWPPFSLDNSEFGL